MKILGISNPDFAGVSIATKAISTTWMPAPHMTAVHERRKLLSAIFHYNPEVLVVGGWSEGYFQLLQELKETGNKEFPILAVCHSTPFHGSYFHKDWQDPEYEKAQAAGFVDLIGFVHPQTAEYYQKVKKTFAVWVPHSFKPWSTPVLSDGPFRIGILGSPSAWFKNTEGAVTVARDFRTAHENVEVITATQLNRPHEAFLAALGTCSVLVHLSHLECYSNTVQEAWLRGIPAITGPSCDGLTKDNPLLPGVEKAITTELRVSVPTDPFQLYEKLARAKEHRKIYSRDINLVYHTLHFNTQRYLHGLFSRLVKDYPNREHDVGFFEAPFTKEGILWEQLQNAR